MPHAYSTLEHTQYVPSRYSYRCTSCPRLPKCSAANDPTCEIEKIRALFFLHIIKCKQLNTKRIQIYRSFCPGFSVISSRNAQGKILIISWFTICFNVRWAAHLVIRYIHNLSLHLFYIYFILITTIALVLLFISNTAFPEYNNLICTATQDMLTGD